MAFVCSRGRGRHCLGICTGCVDLRGGVFRTFLVRKHCIVPPLFAADDGHVGPPGNQGASCNLLAHQILLQDNLGFIPGWLAVNFNRGNEAVARLAPRKTSCLYSQAVGKRPVFDQLRVYASSRPTGSPGFYCYSRRKTGTEFDAADKLFKAGHVEVVVRRPEVTPNDGSRRLEAAFHFHSEIQSC